MALRQTLENEVSVAYESATSKRSSYIPLDHGEQEVDSPLQQDKEHQDEEIEIIDSKAQSEDGKIQPHEVEENQEINKFKKKTKKKRTESMN